MALKTIRVRIKSIEEGLNDAVNAMKAIQSGKRTKKARGDYFDSLDTVRSVLTETRLALLRLIREKRPASVAELSRIAKRDFKSVYTDVELLEELGLVKIAKSKRGVASRLDSNTTEIVFRIAV